MNKIDFKEYHNMSYGEQLQYLEEQIETTRGYKRDNVESIRKLEEYTEQCNKNIETLLEMKFNVLHQQRMEETLDSVKKNVFGE
ncbi:hypothetical protein N8580_00570 [Akkermansiaceae bacterium]|jgi:hypothetical protein|nr:hypothetical protein [Akkermansiaceae bacterium]